MLFAGRKGAEVNLVNGSFVSHRSGGLWWCWEEVWLSFASLFFFIQQNFIYFISYLSIFLLHQKYKRILTSYCFSCLTIQYIANRFVADYDPTLEDSYVSSLRGFAFFAPLLTRCLLQRKQATVNDTECILDIIDTAGQDDFMAIRESYYTDGDGFVCVYGTTPISFGFTFFA